jgi:hypothetical protein
MRYELSIKARILERIIEAQRQKKAGQQEKVEQQEEKSE